MVKSSIRRKKGVNAGTRTSIRPAHSSKPVQLDVERRGRPSRAKAPLTTGFNSFQANRVRLIWTVMVGVLAALLIVASVASRPKVGPDVALAQGLQAHVMGNLEGARDKYAQVLDAQPDNQFALYNLGLIAQGMGRLPEAENFYRKAIAKDPKLTPALFNLALIVEESGDNEGAAALYRSIIEIEPGHAAAHHNYGLLLKNKLNDETAGAAELSKAGSIDPRLGEASKGQSEARSPQQP